MGAQDFSMENQGLILLKPSAATPAFSSYVTHVLREKGVELTGPMEVGMEAMQAGGLIDRHYAAIAGAAMTDQVGNLVLTAASQERFSSCFGLSWKDAVGAGSVFSAAQMMRLMGLQDGAAFLQRWLQTPQSKVGPGLYVARFTQPAGFVLNGFYPALRQRFITPGAKVVVFGATFAPDRIPWERFRRDLIGDTRPQEASPGSLRRCLLERYNDLGLGTQPSVSQNGVHASAGPIEGLRERQIWLGEDPAATPLGQALLKSGLSREILGAWIDNATLTLGGATGPIFDLTENLNAGDVLRLLAPSKTKAPWGASPKAVS